MVTLFDAAVAHEPAVQFRSDGNAVNAWRIGDIADDLAGVDIDDDDMGRVGNVEAARGRVDGEVVPPALAADFDFAEKVVTGRGSEQDGSSDGRGEQHQQKTLTHAGPPDLQHSSNP